MNLIEPDVFSGLAKIMPWPYLLCDRHGKVLHFNLHFERLLDLSGAAVAKGIELKNIFSSHNLDSAVNEVLARVTPEQAWHGRWHLNDNGISLNMELVVQADPANDDLLWVIALEHPVINNQVVLSSQNELRLLQTLMDHTLDYVYFKDNAGRFVITNRAFQRALNVPYPGYEIGKTLSDFTNDDASLAFDEADRTVLNSLEPQINQVEFFQLKAGSGRWLQTTKMPVFNQSRKCIGLVCVSRDISEARENERKLNEAVAKAEQASQAKSDFLANMSHEIRTPINGIIGMTELCIETELEGEQKGYLQTIINCTSTLMALINDILDFSKIEAGQLELEKIRFCFTDCIEEVADAFMPQTREKGIELALQLNSNLPAAVLGDPTRIKQILNNLLSNALKFTEEGEIIVSAETVNDDNGVSTLQITVTDTGIGIPTDRQHAVFNSFTQADNSTTRNYGGTGLGLAICRQLVDLMDGHISVFSEPGQGSTFKVILKLETLSPSSELPKEQLEKLQSLRVLVVDDNQTNRLILTDLCRNWGFRPQAATSGLEALEILEDAQQEEDPIQLVLLDQEMPSLSGLDVAALISNRPQLSRVKVVLLASSLGQIEIQRAADVGIQRYLSKPLKQRALLEAILETFELSVPPVKGEALAHGDSHIPFDCDQPELKCLTILLAEDNPVNQEVCRQRIERMGHDILIVENGRKALEAYQQTKFDLILMDVQMPVMDGFVATQKIRAIEASLGVYTPIIAMTARAMKRDEQCCLEAGMDAYMAKPFRASKLNDILQTISIARREHCFEDHFEAEIEHMILDKQPRMQLAPAEFLTELTAEDQEDIKAAARVFLDCYEEELEDLKKYLDAEEWRNMHYQAHRIKGAVSVFSADRLQSLADSVEKAALQRDRTLIADMISHLDEEIGVLAEELRSFSSQENNQRL